MMYTKNDKGILVPNQTIVSSDKYNIIKPSTEIIQQEFNINDNMKLIKEIKFPQSSQPHDFSNFTNGLIAPTDFTVILILAGQYGCGKGTFGDKSWFEEKGIRTTISGLQTLFPNTFKDISPGKFFRAEIASGSDLGKEFIPYLGDGKIKGNGKLVPDELTFELISKVSGSYKFLIFDGFPRSPSQAKYFLENYLNKNSIAMIVNLEITDEESLSRQEDRAKREKRPLEDFVERNNVYKREAVPAFEDLKKAGIECKNINGMPDNAPGHRILTGIEFINYVIYSHLQRVA